MDAGDAVTVPANQDRSFTLYLAGGSPSAAAAIKTLAEALPELGFSIGLVRIVDVLRQPGEALSAGLDCTPTLVVGGAGKTQWFAGDFAQPGRVWKWLQGVLGTADAGRQSEVLDPFDGVS